MGRASLGVHSLLRRHRVAVLVAMLAVLAIPFFHGLGRWPLMEPDEGRNAEVAREILASGDWIVPHFNGLPFLDKPIALFWMIAGAFRLLGPTEFAARLPSALSGVVLIALTFAVTRTLLDTRRAVVAAVVAATAPLVLVFGRITIFDLPVSACMTLALWCLLRGRLDGRPARWLPLAGAAMGVATLIKGPVGAAVPLLAWFVARGVLPFPARRAGWAVVGGAVAAYLAIVLPWVVLVAVREPSFLHYAVVDETFLRFTSAARFHRGGPPYFHVAGLALGLGAWTLVLLGTIPCLVTAGHGDSRDARAIRFAARAVAAMLLFFSLSASKRPGYILPAVPLMALLVSVGACLAPDRAARAARTLAVGLGATGLAMVALSGGDHLGWAPLVGREVAPAVTGPVLAAAGAFFVAWSAGTLVSSRWHAAGPLLGAAVFAPGLLLALLAPISGYAAKRSARDLARAVPPGVSVTALRTFRTSLPFYLNAVVPLASASGRELTSNFVVAEAARFVGGPFLERPVAFWDHFDRDGVSVVLTSRATLAHALARSARPLEAIAADDRSVLLAPVEPARLAARDAGAKQVLR